MGFKSLGAKKLHPIDADRMTVGSQIKKLLESGYEVTVGPNGWIIDAWDPTTKKLYDDQGEDIGTRDKTFALPEAFEVRTAVAKTFLPEDKGEFSEGSDSWQALNAGYQVTLDKNGTIIDIWDPETKTTKDILGNDIGTRDVSHGEYREQQYRNPMGTTFFMGDIDKFPEGTDAWNALNAGYEVTVDERYNIIDIWHRESGRLFDVNGNEIGTRLDPYPSDVNIEDTRRQYKKLFAEIIELRRAASKERGEDKIRLQSMITAKLRKFGSLVWLYGRLLGRKRRRDKRYENRRSKSVTPQLPNK